MATVKALMLTAWMPLSQWRAVWARKYHLWERADRAHRAGVVRVEESICEPGGAEEMRITFQLDPAEALRVASQDPQVTDDSLIAAPVRYAYQLVRGPGERELSGKHLARSVGLRALVEAWCDGMAVRHRRPDDVEVVHLVDELRLILWRAARVIGEHDPDLPLDYRCWDEMADEVDEIRAVLEAVAREDQQFLGEVEDGSDDRGLQASRDLLRECAGRLHGLNVSEDDEAS